MGICVLRNTCSGVTCVLCIPQLGREGSGPAPGLCVTDLVPWCLLQWFLTFWSQIHKPQGANLWVSSPPGCLSSLSTWSSSFLSAHQALSLFFIPLLICCIHCTLRGQQHSLIFGIGTFQTLAVLPEGLRVHLFKWERLVCPALLSPPWHPAPLAGEQVSKGRQSQAAPTLTELTSPKAPISRLSVAQPSLNTALAAQSRAGAAAVLHGAQRCPSSRGGPFHTAPGMQRDPQRARPLVQLYTPGCREGRGFFLTPTCQSA